MAVCLIFYSVPVFWAKINLISRLASQYYKDISGAIYQRVIFSLTWTILDKLSDGCLSLAHSFHTKSKQSYLSLDFKTWRKSCCVGSLKLAINPSTSERLAPFPSEGSPVFHIWLYYSPLVDCLLFLLLITLLSSRFLLFRLITDC